jgi:enoyl-CoA hydratase
MDLKFSKVTRKGPITIITLSRPEVYNALHIDAHFELNKIFDDFSADPDQWVAIVTGAGDKAFSAGGDLDWVGGMVGKPGAVNNVLKEAADVVYNMLACDKVIISAINGVAVGAGLAVALMADISIIAEDARLTDGHTRLGVAAGDHACIVWPLLCGMAKAKYYLLTCDFIDGREAERIGLVSKAVARPQVLPEAMSVARRLADGPQHALRFTKRALNQWLRLGGIASFDYSLLAEMMGFFGGDVAAGIQGIRERRPADFPSAR